MGCQVFISYANDKGNHSNKDRQVADRIYSALSGKNIRCWLAHKDIPGGERWINKMLDAIEEAQLVLLVFSANANKSQWVMREINHALDKQKTIIPFAIEDVPPQETLRMLKSNFQWVAAYNPPLERHIDKLVEDVQKQLGPSPVHGQWSNPFTDVTAIQIPDRFIGREAEMRRLKTMLQGGSVALLGDHKIGKSSLMLHLVRHWDSSIKIIGPLDCMMLEDRDDFFGQIAGALALDNSNWRTIRNVLCTNAVVLLVDELDLGPDKGLTYNDIGHFRGVCQSNPGFKIMTVSRTPVNQIFPYPGIGSRAYDFLLPYTLEPLNDAEARRLLSHPWAPEVLLFDVETCEQLLKLAGSHPYKLQRAAHHRFDFLANPAYDWQAGYRQDMEHTV